MGCHRDRAAAAASVLVVAVLASLGLELLGVPIAVLFGSLLSGVLHALTLTTPLVLPTATYRLAPALLGAIVATLVTASAVRTLGSALVPILLVTLGTVLISLAAGRVLALRDDVSPVTGAFAMLSGGASGVVAVARELGADERVVTVVQYLRVLVVLVSLPLVTTVVFGAATGGTTPPRPETSLPADLTFVAVTVPGGLLVAGLLRLPTGALLGPLVLGSVLVTTGVFDDVAVPEPLTWVAYGLIGAQVGLRFTRESLRSIARMLPAVLAVIVAVIVLAALMGALLAALTPVDGLTAYLATTPGGLFAVLAAATDGDADVALVLAVQLLRVIVVLLLTPLLSRLLRRGQEDATA